MREYFYRLAGLLDGAMRGSEQYTCWLAAEDSDFVRFNRSAIRQAGHVAQRYLTLSLIDGLRHAKCTLALAGDLDLDLPLIEGAIGDLRAQLPDLPEDPHLLLASDVRSSERIVAARLPEPAAIVDEVLCAAQGHDLVGILAAGPIWRGFANASGQRNWHQAASFHFDWSLYHSRDKAVKASYAGFEWDSAAFRAKFDDAARQLALLGREPVSISPGAYRAYLAPAALNEIIGMLNWGCVSEKSLRTRQSPLCRMRGEGIQLNRAVTLAENTAGGLAPAFQGEGFIKPERVVVLEQGRLVGSMVSPRSAKEYGIATNGADAGEAMTSIALAAGDLPMAQVLERLDTGVFISNLWYLNFSDRMNARMTGMTRFATFWVEHGEIKAPLNVMRFDDSMFRMLGENLIALTRERELIVDSDTYGARSTGSVLMPGALIEDVTFVL